MDKISIIVPVFNCHEHLNRIIMGILKQTYINIEIVIVDGGSSDSSYEMSLDWAFLDDRIKVYKTRESVLEFGLKMATGKYVLFVDTINFDDNDMLNSMYSEIVKNNSDISIYNSNFSKIVNYLVGSSSRFMIKTFDSCLWNKLYRKDLFVDFIIDNNVFQTALKRAVRVTLFV